MSFEKEEELLEEQLANGEITVQEFNKLMNELRRD
jgi:uncharacterized membrane protein